MNNFKIIKEIKGCSHQKVVRGTTLRILRNKRKLFNSNKFFISISESGKRKNDFLRGLLKTKLLGFSRF